MPNESVVVTPNLKLMLPQPDSPASVAITLLNGAIQAIDALLASAYATVASLAAYVTKAAQQTGGYTFALDTGAANTYAVALTPVTAIAQGSAVTFLAANLNTDASILAVNGGAAKAITKAGTTALAGGEIAVGQIVHVVYDGTQFQIV